MFGFAIKLFAIKHFAIELSAIKPSMLIFEPIFVLNFELIFELHFELTAIKLFTIKLYTVKLYGNAKAESGMFFTKTRPSSLSRPRPSPTAGSRT